MKKKTVLLRVGLAIAGLTASISAAAQWTPLEMGTYKNIDVTPVHLIYQPEVSGTLTVTQYGSNDPHIWTNEECTQYFDPIDHGYKVGFDGEVIYNYAVEAGETYYCVAPTSKYDDIDEIQFSFVAASDEGMEVIEEGVPFKAYDKVMKFTPAESGVLSVSVSQYVFGLVGATWSFIYTDPTHSNSVLPLNPASDGPYKFDVIGGKTYYFYQRTNGNLSFTFNMGGDLDVQVIQVRPTPGTAFDPVNYIGGAQIFFEPATISIESATFSYTDAATGEVVSTPVVTERQGDAYGIKIYDAYNKAINNVEDGSACTITLTGVSYNGLPVTSSSVTGVNVDNGTVTFDYIFSRPIAIAEQTWPETMYSFWDRGESDGIATIVFTRDLTNVEGVVMIQGHQTYGAPPSSEEQLASFNIPFSYEGNTLTINFTGVNRSIEDAKEVTVMVSGIRGDNGLAPSFGGFPVLQKYIPYVDAPYINTGVEAIESAAAYEVFTIQGVKVLSGASRDALNNLPAGLYIINGKKVVVK